MSTMDDSLGPEAKRKKLDELFADDPYLSPTMKARTLHERLQGLHSNGNGEATQGLPTQAYVSDRAPAAHTAPSVQSAPAYPPIPEPDEPKLASAPAGILSFAEAARLLRTAPDGDDSPSDADPGRKRLYDFRDGELTRWLQELGEKR